MVGEAINVGFDHGRRDQSEDPRAFAPAQAHDHRHEPLRRLAAGDDSGLRE